MGIKKNIEIFTDDTSEYLDAYIDVIKLRLLERLSLFASDILSRIIFLQLLFIAAMFVSVAIMLAIAPFTGYIAGALIIASLLLLAAIILTLSSRRIFVNSVVAYMSRIFFSKDDSNDETE